MDTADTVAFLKEREEKLGSPIVYKTYTPWFARLGGERRDWGVFLYTDGKTIIYEDFEREPMILGIPIPGKKKEKYTKLECSFPVSSVVSIDCVTRTSAEDSLSRGHDVSKAATVFGKAFRKLVTKVTLSDGRILFFETMNHKEFSAMMEKFQKEGK